MCAFQNVTSKDVKLNEKTVKSYLKFRDFLFGGQIKAESNAIFLDKLRKRILSKVISKEDLAQLNNKPLAPMVIKKLIESKEHQILPFLAGGCVGNSILVEYWISRNVKERPMFISEIVPFVKLILREIISNSHSSGCIS